MSSAADATVPVEPTTKMLCGASDVPDGTVIETLMDALLVTVEGDPVRIGPVGESKRKERVSPTVKLAIVPASTTGSAAIGAVDERLYDATDTVVSAPRMLIAPVQEPCFACTEYRQVPYGTLFSMQLVVVTVKQFAPIVCRTPAASYRRTTY